MRAPTSRKYVTEQVILMPNLLQTLQPFWIHSSVFPSKKYPKSAKVLDILPLKEAFMATLSETCTLTSRANVAGKGMTIPNLSDTLRLFWSHSSVFALEEKSQKC